MERQVTKIEINKIRMDGGTQPREALEHAAVQDYSEAMKQGATFPPVIVFHDGENCWLADGFHRVKAAVNAGLKELDCEVRQGNLDDAQWFSFSANKTNGLRRTNADKQRAVKAALLHPKGAVLSDSQIAEHVGVDQKTVTNWRHQLQATQEIPKSQKRTGRDGRTINTTNIGRRKRRTDGPTSNMADGVEPNTPASTSPEELRRNLEMPEAGEAKTVRANTKRPNPTRPSGKPRTLKGALRVARGAWDDLVEAWRRASIFQRRNVADVLTAWSPEQPWRAATGKPSSELVPAFSAARHSWDALVAAWKAAPDSDRRAFVEHYSGLTWVPEQPWLDVMAGTVTFEPANATSVDATAQEE
jgi:transposase-like protein